MASSVDIGLLITSWYCGASHRSQYVLTIVGLLTSGTIANVLCAQIPHSTLVSISFGVILYGTSFVLMMSWFCSQSHMVGSWCSPSV